MFNRLCALALSPGYICQAPVCIGGVWRNEDCPVVRIPCITEDIEREGATAEAQECLKILRVMLDSITIFYECRTEFACLDKFLRALYELNGFGLISFYGLRFGPGRQVWGLRAVSDSIRDYRQGDRTPYQGKEQACTDLAKKRELILPGSAGCQMLSVLCCAGASMLAEESRE